METEVAPFYFKQDGLFDLISLQGMIQVHAPWVKQVFLTLHIKSNAVIFRKDSSPLLLSMLYFTLVLGNNKSDKPGFIYYGSNPEI